MRLRGLTGCAVAGLVAVGIAGCGSDSSGAGAGETPGVPTVKSERDLPELPLEHYEFSDRDNERHTEAQARLTQQCMRDLGFDDFPLYPEEPSGRQSVTLTAVAVTSYPYGPLDLDAARRWGYGYDPKKSGAADGRTKGRAMTDKEYEALYGLRRKPSGSGGCAGAGGERLMAGVPDEARMWTYTSERSRRLDKVVAKDERVRDALGAWSRCMADKGVKRYKTPGDAFGDKAWGRKGRSDGNTTRTRRELATAVADVECKREQNTAGVWWVVREEKQSADVAGHKDAYEAVRADQQRVRANVRRILGEK
ncbi:hypothetical protein OG453_24825 [Streptomyces sp. NBC_01381]|uniref:hypothetical protein n=1 Tax=Streptomyces sp. NBC_01381 TaxID=2903845 RepID=UPI0022578D29|nr:hypothetical protein [Streptomyces sp. NBC_01381]MCX4669870.1 hypothetical protein [Streptomyces sp. NBC_01381]